MKTNVCLLTVCSALLFTQLATLAAPGDLDPLDISVKGPFVFSTAAQPDGKTIVVGSFNTVLGVPRFCIARLNADGTLDMSFDPKPNNEINSAVVQMDGKILIGGLFTTLQPPGASAPIARNYIARLNTDGTLDMGFDPNPSGAVENYINCIAVQTDGKVLFGGRFTKLQPNGASAASRRIEIARVNADGSLDIGFDPSASSPVFSLAIQSDGKVVVGGRFQFFPAKRRGGTHTTQSHCSLKPRRHARRRLQSKRG